MGKPDWKKDSSTHGGHIADIPKPHVRRFPHKGLKREVVVDILTFVGAVAYARHWRPSVEEEDNPIWNSEEDTWQYAWDDREKNGTRVDGPNFTSEAGAREWVRRQLRAWDPEVYKVRYKHHERPPKWFYSREGD